MMRYRVGQKAAVKSAKDIIEEYQSVRDNNLILVSNFYSNDDLFELDLSDVKEAIEHGGLEGLEILEYDDEDKSICLEMEPHDDMEPGNEGLRIWLSIYAVHPKTNKRRA